MQIPPLIDLHQDLALYYFTGGESFRFEVADFALDLRERPGDIPKYRRANVKLVFTAVFPMVRTFEPEAEEALTKAYGSATPSFVPRSSASIALELIKIYYALQRKYSNQIELVENIEDLTEVMQSDKIGFLISLEGTEAVEDVSDLEVYRKLGVRSLTLTWNYDTKYASSCMSEKDYGLTGMGRKLVEAANKMGIILDLAHAGKRACLDVIELSDLPVIISHANAASVHSHKRNVDDQVLAALKRNGGVIGLTCIRSTLGSRQSIDGLVEHVKYLKDHFGSGILAIGTDYFGLLRSGAPEGLDDISMFPNLWAKLEAEGFNRDELEAISFRNALKVIESNARRWAS